MNLPTIFTKAQNVIIKNSTTILTGVGVAGIVTTTIMSITATPKACRLINDAVEEPSESVKENIQTLGVKETIKVTWKCYIPTIISGALTIAAFIASYKTSATKQAAIASAYSLLEKTYKTYQDNVIELIGEEKHKEIKDSIAKTQLESTDSEEIIPYGYGETLCFDGITGRYFKSDIETIRTAMNNFNQELLRCFYMDVNSWFIELGLPSIQLGDLMGWNSDHMIDIYFSSQIAANGEPCVVLDYSASLPSPFYRKAIL